MKVLSTAYNCMHGLDIYDYGARQYDPVLARWDRMDPLCEKYYSISPYAYCANNPMKFIDPDGKEIWIYYNDTNGHEQSFQYSVGMSCTVNNSAAQAFVNNLNTMSTNNAGKTVIDAIVKSKTKYGYVQADTRSKSGEGYFDPITKTTSINDVNNTLAFAEETFHMYQYVNNRGGRTAVNEVEAKLFSAKMNCEISEWDNGDYLKIFSGLDNSPYSKHMINLFWGGYDYDSFKGAVNSFFSGSLSGKLYKEDIGYEEGNIDSHQLIKNFLPVNQ